MRSLKSSILMKFFHGPMNSNDVGIETNNGEIGRRIRTFWIPRYTKLDVAEDQLTCYLIFSPKSIGSIYSEIMALSFVSSVHGPSVLAGWWASVCGKIGCWVKQCINVTPFCCSYMSFYNPFWVTKHVISKQVVIMTSGIYRHKAQAHTDGRAGNLWMPRGPATWTGASWMKDQLSWNSIRAWRGRESKQSNELLI